MDKIGSLGIVVVAGFDGERKVVEGLEEKLVVEDDGDRAR